MNENLNRMIRSLKPFKGILFFVVLLFFFHISWKLTIAGDMPAEKESQRNHLFGIDFSPSWFKDIPKDNCDDRMWFLGKDITPSWFAASNHGMVKIVAWFIHLFPNTQDLIVDGDKLRFDTEGNSWISIVWGCLGFKQMLIYAGIILFYWGPFLKKLWYIPLGCFILSVYNVIRIATTVWLTNGAPERFNSLHDGILRYIYYTILFLLWVVWEEFIVKKKYKYTIR